MDEAAPQAAGRLSAGEIKDALRALNMVWGDEYLIGHDPERGFWATPRGVPTLFTAATPEELGNQLADAALAGPS
jgi:hypothetical protein